MMLAQISRYGKDKEKISKDSLLAYCVAMGNSGGGIIVFGVDNNKKICGTNSFLNIEDTKSKIYNAFGAKIGLEEFHLPEGRVVVIMVPSRTKGRLFRFHGMYLTRNGEDLIEMNQDEIRDILHESVDDFTAKYIDADITYLDSSAINKMRQLYEKEHTENESL